MKGKTNLRDLSEGELGQKARELREEVFNLRFRFRWRWRRTRRASPGRRELAVSKHSCASGPLGLRAARRGEAKRAEDPVGLVVSDKMSKTGGCRGARSFRHPRYERVIADGTVQGARQQNGARGRPRGHRGDPPLSKDKRWRIKESSSGPPEPPRGRSHDSAADDAGRRRQLGREEGAVYPGDGRLEQEVRVDRGHDHRGGEGSDPDGP